MRTIPSSDSPHVSIAARKCRHTERPKSWNNHKPSSILAKESQNNNHKIGIYHSRHNNKYLLGDETSPSTSSPNKHKNNKHKNNNSEEDMIDIFDASHRTSETMGTNNTGEEYASPFFPEATFGNLDYAAYQKHKRPNETEIEFLARIERILRFAQKRLKKARVEPFYEKKKKRNNRADDGGILHVEHSDVQLGDVLGNGSYNIVYSVKRIKGHVLDAEDIVVKTLRSKLLGDLPMLAACAADLRKEGLLLAALQQQPQEPTKTKRRNSLNRKPPQYHPGASHVLKVLAWSPTGLSAFANGCHDSFFVVLEKLDKTLTDTLKEWKALEATEDAGTTTAVQTNAKKSFRRNLKTKGSSCSRRSMLLSSVKNSFFKNGDGGGNSNSNSNGDKCPGSPAHESCGESSTEFHESMSSSNGNSNSNSNLNQICNATSPEQIRFWKLRLQILLDLCAAVSFLHSQKVLHRDLKPDNVGFDKHGKLKVFDFDVARVLPQQSNWGIDSKNETFKMTKKVGSPRYMSPEVARGEHYNEKTDVYALGLMAYEILSLKRPFDALSTHHNIKNGGANININTNSAAYKDCVEVVIKCRHGGSVLDGDGDGNEHNTNEEELSRTGRKQKRRNSFPFRRPTGDSNSTNSSGKLSGSIFKRRSRSRSSTKKNRRNPPKYANIRPLLPVATPLELAAANAASEDDHGPSKNSNATTSSESKAASKTSDSKNSSKSSTTKSSKRRSKSSDRHKPSKLSGSASGSGNVSGNGSKGKSYMIGVQQHLHSVNDIAMETSSFYWTQSLRTTIDRAWSYDIPTRPFASEFRNSLAQELERVRWLEEEIGNNSNN